MAGTSYDTRIIATDGGRSSSKNTIALFTTEEAGDNNAPSAPSNVSASNVTNTSAEVSWQASEDLDGDSISYDVAYRVSGEVDWISAGTTSETTLNLGGLDEGVSYDVSVTATDGIAGTTTEEASLFTTPVGTPKAPSQPSNITASNVGSDSALISWDPSIDPNGDAVTYKVRYRETGTASWSTLVQVSEPTYLLTGLMAGTSYDTRIIATDGGRSTSKNTIALFTTPSAATATTWRSAALASVANIRSYLRG